MRGGEFLPPHHNGELLPSGQAVGRCWEEAENDFQVVTGWGANYQKNMLADLLQSVCPPASGTAELVRKKR
ncbi:hypothetical protein FQN60_007932, partial [Etheostoma spectabile]